MHRSNKQISVVQWIVSSVKHQYSTPVKVNNMTLLIDRGHIMCFFIEFN